MKKRVLILSALLTLSLVGCGSAKETNAPIDNSVEVSAPVETATPEPTVELTPAPTVEPTATPEPTPTQTTEPSSEEKFEEVTIHGFTKLEDGTVEVTEELWNSLITYYGFANLSEEDQQTQINNLYTMISQMDNEEDVATYIDAMMKILNNMYDLEHGTVDGVDISVKPSTEKPSNGGSNTQVENTPIAIDSPYISERFGFTVGDEATTSDDTRCTYQGEDRWLDEWNNDYYYAQDSGDGRIKLVPEQQDTPSPETPSNRTYCADEHGYEVGDTLTKYRNGRQITLTYLGNDEWVDSDGKTWISFEDGGSLSWFG